MKSGSAQLRMFSLLVFLGLAVMVFGIAWGWSTGQPPFLGLVGAGITNLGAAGHAYARGDRLILGLSLLTVAICVLTLLIGPLHLLG